MGWLDNMIGWISPRAACAREAWRQQLNILRGAGYDAAGHDRINAAWRVNNESADLTDRYARDTIRARARDLERNSDIANAILHAYKRNVIGRGFALQARTKDDALNNQIEELWQEWTRRRNCDVTGQQSFNQMLRMAVVRKKIDGGLLFKKCYTRGGLLPFKLQILEVDELSSSATQAHSPKNRVVGGVEYDETGAPVGYWIEQYAIDGWEITQPVYHKAKDIIFYYSKKRPSQLREISDFAPVLSRVRDVNEFITAVSIKERIASCLAVFIKKIVPTTGFGRNTQAAEANIEYAGKSITPGMIMELNAGDEAQILDPGNGASDAAQFVKAQERLIGAGQGISYEAVSRDLSGTTYSSARQGAIEDDLAYQEDIELLQENVMDEVYETFVISAVLAGLLNIPDFWENKRAYLRHDWVASPKRWIDPQKEANANKIAMQSGQKTFKQIAAEQGRDWKEQIDDMAEAIQYAQEKGVSAAAIGIASGKEEQEDELFTDDDE
ncbi:MAG: phage portal protein [Eubacteriales bacterium]|nr:phage portal protein [Eubacteriales bacterium]